MADIKMCYIIIEKYKDENRSIEQIVFSCLDNSNYKRDNENLYMDENNSIKYNLKHKKNAQRYYLEIESKLRVNKGVEVLSKLDVCLLKSSEQKYINIIRVYDGVSAVFCEKLYPKYGLFERLLRQLILLVLTKAFGVNWREETISGEKLKDIKRVAKAKGTLSLSDTLEQMDLNSMEKYLFERREINYQTFFYEKLDKDIIKKKEKEELCELIEEMRPRSLWERNFEMIGKQEIWEKQISEIHDYRNKVAHSKNITKAEYEFVNKKLNKINNDLKTAILKLQDNDFENVNYVDILSNFALAVGKMARSVVVNYDFSKILSGINRIVQEMVIPLRETYTSNLTSMLRGDSKSLCKITDTYVTNKKFDDMSVNYAKMATAFESARELDEITKQFSES